MDNECMIEKINSPCDIKTLSYAELDMLASEIRRVIIDTVSENGGHLASNLGMVEATIALHTVFDSPKDKIIFDVGHQCYAHKLLTGRFDRFSTLRRFGGISGFTNPEESEHDVLYEGHSGTSVSAALGIAAANKLRGDDSYTVAVVGDGSLTNGMIYEALNNCADSRLNLIIVVNDNEMSISPNVGGLHNYLSRLRVSKGYFTFKRGFERWLLRLPLIGTPMAKLFKAIKDAIKHVFVKDTIFEDLGLVYIGPVDGNNIKKLKNVFSEAKLKHKCCVVHMRTRKGLGYPNAEARPDRYHSVSKFDIDEGEITEGKVKTMSEYFGDALAGAAGKDERICAITAAMCDGTGLGCFKEAYPDRFFDVGIAEEHAVTFASGLAVSGLRPVVALYSTFSQRVCDQLIHDVSIQKLPLVLALDRCGLVPGDGITHQGIFDYSLFSAIPGAVIYSCADGDDISEVLPKALTHDGLAVMRYPKGEAFNGGFSALINFGDFSCTENIEKAEIIIVTHGRMTKTALLVREEIGQRVGVVKLLRVFPLEYNELAPILTADKTVYVLDEGYASGGMGEKLGALLGRSVYTRSVRGFVEHGGLGELYGMCGFDKDAVLGEIKELIKK